MLSRDNLAIVNQVFAKYSSNALSVDDDDDGDMVSDELTTTMVTTMALWASSGNLPSLST